MSMGREIMNSSIFITNKTNLDQICNTNIYTLYSIIFPATTPTDTKGGGGGSYSWGV